MNVASKNVKVIPTLGAMRKLRMFIPARLLLLIFLASIMCKSSEKSIATKAEQVYSDRAVVYPIEGLVLRSAPNKSSKALKVLPIGTELVIISRHHERNTVDWRQDYWYEVQAAGLTGWVFGAYVYKIINRPESQVMNIYEENGLYVILTNDHRFWLTISNCEGGTTIEGSVKQSGRILHLALDQPVPYTRNVIFTELSSKKIRIEEMLSWPNHPNWPACGPFAAQVFTRVFSHGS